MAARAIGSVTLSFGLVAIPVKIYGAVQSGNAVQFNLLTADGSRVSQQYVSKTDGSVVARDTLIKGYEYSKDQYVTFTADELKALDDLGTKAIEVNGFVPFDSIDPVYLDKTYHLVPDKAAEKPYALFAQAMSESAQVGIGTWVNRGSAHIVVVRAIKLEDGRSALAMQQLHYGSEVRDVNDLEIPTPKQAIKPAELNLAKQLIASQSSSKYDPTAIKDEYTARVEAAIQAKLEGKPMVVATEAATAPAADLMAALQASLQKQKAA